MAQTAVNAARLQLGKKRGENAELPVGEVRLRRVRLGEVSKDPFDLQSGQRGDTLNFRGGAFHIVQRMAVQSEPRHARIDLDMYADRSAGGKLRGIRVGSDRLHDVIRGNRAVQLLRGDAEDEQLSSDAAAAQQRRFLHTGDGKMRLAGRRKTAADLDGAMAVGVGLDDGHHDAVFSRFLAQIAVILFYIIQTDTRFGPVFTQVTTSFISVMRYSVFFASFI